MIFTDRLILTPISLSDASFVIKLVQTKEYIENIGLRDIRTIEDSEMYIQTKMIDHFDTHGYGNYLITLKSDKSKIGTVSLYNRPDVEGVDIGFALLPEYFKQGIGFEASSALLEYGKTELKLKEICAFTAKNNVASQRLIEKLGLTFSNTILFGKEQEELLYYKITF